MDDSEAFRIVRRKMPQDDPAPIPGFAAGHNLEFALYIRDTVANGIRTYANSDPTSEIGGALFGRHYQSEGEQTVVEVNDFTPLPSGDRSQRHYTFDAGAIRALRQFKQTDSKYLVGWFHSHPGFGDPFMSVDDIDLHKRNFTAPWYVSCVIGGGQYSLPLGFFRVANGELLNIDQYFVAMTLAPVDRGMPSSTLKTSVGEASRRFVRASVGETQPLQISMMVFRKVFNALGIGLSKALQTYLDDTTPHEENPLRPKPFWSLFQLALLARLLKENPEVDAEIKQVEGELRKINLFSDSVLTVFGTKDLGDIFAVSNSRCLSANRGEPTILIGNFDANIFIPVLMSPDDAILDVTFSDFEGWILSSRGIVTRLEFAYGDAHPNVSVDFDKRFTKHFVAVKKQGDDRELKVSNSRLYIRDAEHIWQSNEMGGQTGGQLGETKRIQLPTEHSFLVRDFQTRQVGLVYQSNQDVFFRPSFDDSSEVKLNTPSWFKGHSIRASSLATVGVCLLTERESASTLWIFEKTGELQSLVAEDPLQPTQMKSIASDEKGRLFVLTASQIGLLIESGVPSESWHNIKVKHNQSWPTLLAFDLPNLSGEF
jgi:proteasome lid subunit RPN8/RPN11